MVVSSAIELRCTFLGSSFLQAYAKGMPSISYVVPSCIHPRLLTSSLFPPVLPIDRTCRAPDNDLHLPSSSLAGCTSSCLDPRRTFLTASSSVVAADCLQAESCLPRGEALSIVPSSNDSGSRLPKSLDVGCSFPFLRSRSYLLQNQCASHLPLCSVSVTLSSSRRTFALSSYINIHRAFLALLSTSRTCPLRLRLNRAFLATILRVVPSCVVEV